MMFEAIEERHWERGVACDFCGSRGPHRLLVENASNNRHNLVECACGLRFFDPRVNEQWIVDGVVEHGKLEADSCCARARFHGEPDLMPPEQQIAATKRYYAATYRSTILPLLKSTGLPRIYEVGGGVGWFLISCIEEGASKPFSRMNDLNPHSCEAARRTHGINVDPGLFRLQAPQNGYYGVILANDVLEHTYTPHGDLRKMREIAAPGAVLWLKTFIDDLDVPLGRKMMLPPWHSHHFTRATLTRAVTSAGWKIAGHGDMPTEGQVAMVATAV